MARLVVKLTTMRAGYCFSWCSESAFNKTKKQRHGTKAVNGKTQVSENRLKLTHDADASTRAENMPVCL